MDGCVKTASTPRVTRRPDLIYLQKQTIAVAINAKIYQFLRMAAGGAFNPEFLARPRPIGNTAGGQRARNGLCVHPSHH